MYVIEKNGEYYRAIKTVFGKGVTWTRDIELATVFMSRLVALTAISNLTLTGVNLKEYALCKI